jgi:hypothetical protein
MWRLFNTANVALISYSIIFLPFNLEVSLRHTLRAHYTQEDPFRHYDSIDDTIQIEARIG